MLRWLHAKLPERFRVLGSLWLICFGAHTVLLIISATLGGTSGRQTLVLSAAHRNKDARIVLLPMYKTVRNTKFDQPTPRLRQAGSKKVEKKPVQKVAKKSSPLIPSESRSDLYRGKPKVTPKKKPSTTLASKKTEQKTVKKPAPKVASSFAKATADRQNKKTVKKPDKSKIATQVAKNKSVEKKEAGENIIYVGRDDLRAMQTQNVVADALQKNWRPPSGIAQDTVCQIAFDVGKDGKARNVTMKEGSQVLIFDVAARTAIMHAHFSRAAHGKQFTVAFKP